MHLINNLGAVDGKRWSIAIGTSSGILEFMPRADNGSVAPVAQRFHLYRDGHIRVQGTDRIVDTGSPEGVKSAPVGSEYTDTAVTNGALKWIKRTGSGSTGWRVLDGDTGRRNIATAVTWDETRVATADANLILAVQRTGQTVYLTLTFRVATSAPNTSGNIFTDLPSGFRPLASGATVAIIANTTGNTSIQGIARVAAAGVLGAVSTPGQLASVSFSYVTGDAWPTTLPGTAI